LERRNGETQWDVMQRQIMEEFRNKPDRWLQQRQIRRCLHPRQEEQTLEYWEMIQQDEWLMQEILPKIGDPPIGTPLLNRQFSPTGLHSPLTLQHAYYLPMMKEYFGFNLWENPDIDYFLEIGGGYGNFARIMRTLGSNFPEHVICDLPGIQEIQKTYLAKYDNIKYTLLNERSITPRNKQNPFMMATHSINEMPMRDRRKVPYRSYKYMFIIHNEKFDGVDNFGYFNDLREELKNEYNIEHWRDETYRKSWNWIAIKK